MATTTNHAVLLVCCCSDSSWSEQASACVRIPEAHLLSSNQAKALLSRNLHALPLPWHGNHFRRGQFTAALSQQFRLLAVRLQGAGGRLQLALRW